MSLKAPSAITSPETQKSVPEEGAQIVVLVVFCLRNAYGSIHAVAFSEHLLRARPYTRLEMDRRTEPKTAYPLGTGLTVWGFSQTKEQVSRQDVDWW